MQSQIQTQKSKSPLWQNAEHDAARGGSDTVSTKALDEMTRAIAALVSDTLGNTTASGREAIHKESWFTTMKRDRAAFKSVISYELVLTKLKSIHEKQGLVDESEIAILECMHYLTYCEGPLQALTGQLCLYAVRGGKSFEVRREPQTISISTPEAILETSLDEKLNFLAACGVRIPSGTYNRKLRNSIAHLDFSVERDGSISNANERITYQRLERSVWNIRDVFVAMYRAISGVVGKFLKQDGWKGPYPPSI